jgi:glutamine---fructose-6-phosphate transaminase (isomerizing)
MCGIVGYVGHRDALGLLVDGLAQLEYRGYDSAGVSLLDESGIHSRRAVGNLDALRDALDRDWDADPSAQVGIGHTRWATHGDVTVANAHPHTSCDGSVHIVLNGIVENHEQLRDELTRRGCSFSSQTDAEVVAHLIGCRFKGVDLAVAVRMTSDLLKGHYAFLALRADEPHMLVGSRHDCPMVIGLGDGEAFVASAIAALPEEMTEVAFIGDDEVAIVRNGELVVTTHAGVPVNRVAETVTRDAGGSDRGGYSSFMRKEVAEQPDALRRTVAAHVGRNPVFGGVTAEQLISAPRITLVGCGTSHNAAQVGQMLLQRWARIPTTTAIASEWCSSAPLLDPGELVVGVTQSGETRDTVTAIRLARDLGAPTIALTNAALSQATREADAVIQTHAGIEVGVAATKTFTTQVAAFALLALHLARARNARPAAELDEIEAELCRLPGLVTETIADVSAPIAAVAAKHADRDLFMYLGRDLAYPVAREGALKMKEISYVPADAYPAGEMKHGPLALLSGGTPVVCVATDSPVLEKLLSNLSEARARGAATVVVASAGQHRVRDYADAVCWLPPVHPDLQPILAAIPLQLLALEVAEARGLNVDQPRNLAKTVTVE